MCETKSENVHCFSFIWKVYFTINISNIILLSFLVNNKFYKDEKMEEIRKKYEDLLLAILIINIILRFLKLIFISNFPIKCFLKVVFSLFHVLNFLCLYQFMQFQKNIYF